ncbi:hypothetical protein JCM3766R1_005370 [Sporobolomyces carnicolor]
MSRNRSDTPATSSSRTGSSRASNQGSSSNLIKNIPRQVHWGSDKIASQPSNSERSESPQIERARAREDLQEDEDADEFEGVTLAISVLRGQLGCVYYDANDNKIYFLEDQAISTDYDLASLVLNQVLPTTVLTSSNADSDFVSFLEETLATLPSPPSSSSNPAASVSASSDPSGPSIRFEIRPAREFYAGQGRHLLSRLGVREGAWYSAEEELAREKRGNQSPEFDGDAMRRNRELRLKSFMSGLEKSLLALGCAGALVTALKRIKASQGDLQPDRFTVSGLKLMQMNKVMQINADALTSLQIFQEEAHASMHAARGKEGLSIFGIVNLTRSPLGSVLMRQWLIRPSLEINVIEERHETVAHLLRPENVAAADAIRSHLKSVKNANKALLALLSGRGKLREWSNLYAMLCFSIMIRDAALTLAPSRRLGVVERLQAALDNGAFCEIGQLMNQVIDWETSTTQKGRVCVRPGIDSNLDELRRQLEGLPSLLSEIATKFAEKFPLDSLPDEISFVYFPQLGYLVRTQPRVPTEVLEEYVDAAFDFQFESEHSGYYKYDKCRDLDYHIGDLQSLVSVQALLERVGTIESSVKATTEVLAEFDCLLAFAEAARDNDWTRPRMIEEPVIKIQGGRHPLAELCANDFVRNDTALVGGRGIDWHDGMKTDGDGAENRESWNKDERSMIVIAGANMSGKSVYLKQIALITYLAHLGSFVPAEKALVGLTDRIMTRVSTKESVAKGSSAFMIDLQQISYMLRNATPRSLLVIDEFGKGTESNDGAGLFCGVVQSLLGLGRATPRTVVATHFQFVFANGLLSRQLPVHLAHMEVLIHDPASSSESPSFTSSRSSFNSSLATSSRKIETLTYLYRLAPGLMRSSHAAACARLFEIPERVVERANFVTDALSRFDLEAISRGSEEEDDAGAEETRGLEDLARRFAAWDLDECDGCDADEVRARLVDLLTED